MITTKVIKKFECRAELTSMGSDESILAFFFYNEEGRYIGDVDDFKDLVEKRGIFPETYDDNEVCSIGKSQKDGKWYGWGREIYGFSIGCKVKEGDCCASSPWTEEYLKDHPNRKPLPVGFVAKTDADCRRMAIAFANSVS